MLSAQVYELQKAFHDELHDIHLVPYTEESRKRLNSALERYHSELLRLVSEATPAIDRWHLK